MLLRVQDSPQVEQLTHVRVVLHRVINQAGCGSKITGLQSVFDRNEGLIEVRASRKQMKEDEKQRKGHEDTFLLTSLAVPLYNS